MQRPSGLVLLLSLGSNPPNKPAFWERQKLQKPCPMLCHEITSLSDLKAFRGKLWVQFLGCSRYIITLGLMVTCLDLAGDIHAAGMVAGRYCSQNSFSCSSIKSSWDIPGKGFHTLPEHDDWVDDITPRRSCLGNVAVPSPCSAVPAESAPRHPAAEGKVGIGERLVQSHGASEGRLEAASAMHKTHPKFWIMVCYWLPIYLFHVKYKWDLSTDGTLRNIARHSTPHILASFFSPYLEMGVVAAQFSSQITEIALLQLRITN